MLWHARGTAVLLLGLIVAFATVGLGCGNGSRATDASRPNSSVSSRPDSSGASAGSSRSKFIASADAICRQTNAQLAAVQSKGRGPDQIAATVVEHETIERRAAGRLARLTPPAEIVSTWTRMLGLRRSLANQLGSLAAAFRNRATASIKLLGASKKRLHSQVRQLASSAGLKDCVKVGSQ
jgi:hypothetical protein